MKRGIAIAVLMCVLLALVAFTPAAVIRINVPRMQRVGIMCESGAPRIIAPAQETSASFILIQCQ